MKLECIVRSFSPASVSFCEGVASTKNPDSLNKFDIAASLSFLGDDHIIGLQLYLAKMKINTPDTVLKYLNQLALGYFENYPSLKKLKPLQLESVLKIICACAFEDYARSAASTRPCNTCKATGFVEAEVFTNRGYDKNANLTAIVVKINQSDSNAKNNWQQKHDIVHVLCKKCNGKGHVSSACQCRGRGKVINRKKTELTGMPIIKNCSRCQGTGFTRLSFSVVLERLKPVWPIGKNVGYREIKPFFNMLVAHCHAEESQVEKVLKESHNTKT